MTDPANVCGCWHCGHGSEVHGVDADGLALLRTDPNALKETECTACSCAAFILTDPEANATPTPVDEVTVEQARAAVRWYAEGHACAKPIDDCLRSYITQTADLRAKLKQAERERDAASAIARAHLRGLTDNLSLFREASAERDAANARVTALEAERNGYIARLDEAIAERNAMGDAKEARATESDRLLRDFRERVRLAIGAQECMYGCCLGKKLQDLDAELNEPAIVLIPNTPTGRSSRPAFVTRRGEDDEPECCGLQNIEWDEYSDEHYSFGRRVRALRRSLRLTLTEAAVKLRIGLVQLSELERGQHSCDFDAIERELRR